MKFTNTYRYVVLKQVMFLILFLIILVCMIKIDLEYLKQEVLIVFAFKTYEIHKYISLCGIKAGNVLDSILNYFSVHD